jgi:polyhydroxybutyrate depolymerase
MLSGGRVRTFLLHVPLSYDGRQRMPLVIVLHGGGGNADSVVEMSGMSARADSAGFIAVYPNGTGALGNDRLLTWNVGNCCGYALDNGVDDVGFIRGLIARLEVELAIDPARVYATGVSNGGMLSYYLAVELSDKIAAIAPVSGAMDMPDPQPGSPVSVIIFHGTADEHVLYNGGVPLQQLDTHTRVDKSVAYAVNFWVAFDGCTLSGNVTRGHIITTSYGGGKNGTGVVLYAIVGGGHAWPGGNAVRLGGDTPTQEISATDLMWDFFAAHPKR